jgi:hypothetical protein
MASANNKLGRPTAGTIVVGAIVGAVAGGLFGMVRGRVQRAARPKGPDLGYEWPHVRTDHDLCEFIGRLTVFRRASTVHYKAVGDACDDMVALMILAHDYTVPAQALWQTRSFRYMKRVGDALGALSDAVIEARHATTARLVAERRASPKTRNIVQTQRGDMVEFETCAEGIYTIMKTYHASIARTIATRSGGASFGVGECVDDDSDSGDGSDLGSDASDFDSDYTDDDQDDGSGSSGSDDD